MRGITFDHRPLLGRPDPERMDVACFIGFTALKPEPGVPASLWAWWTTQGLVSGPQTPAGAAAALDRLPVPIHSWGGFTHLFDEHRISRQARVRGLPLDDPLDVGADPVAMGLLVDGRSYHVSLVPRQGRLDADALVSQLNARFGSAETRCVEAAAEREASGTRFRLVLRRTLRSGAGELTVYRNPQLGFPQARQDDSYLLGTYLAAAVRGFFRQGGRRCYVLRMGDPLPFEAAADARFVQALRLLWGDAAAGRYRTEPALQPADAAHLPLPSFPDTAEALSRRRGVAIVPDLVDVTYVCFPDLVDVLAERPMAVPRRPQTEAPEIFVACGREISPTCWYFSEDYRAPALGRAAFTAWKRLVHEVLDYLQRWAPRTQFLTTLPLPAEEMRQGFSAFVASHLFPPAASPNSAPDRYKGLQLVFPWIKTHDSDLLPERLEPPEGALAGLLARAALESGAYRSVAGTAMVAAYDCVPDDIAPRAGGGDTPALSDRVSWVGRSPEGLVLETDVTAVVGGVYRHAAVRRIMLIVQRAAYRLGRNQVFDRHSRQSWERIRRNLSDLLLGLYQDNGLRGRTAGDAFEVVCDRSTMSQQDIDNGHIIARIALQPAVPIDHIAVDLVLQRDGGMDVRSLSA